MLTINECFLGPRKIAFKPIIETTNLVDFGLVKDY